MRGFTTLRDLAGADLGLKLAVDEGAIEAPRLVICGKALSQTVGHGDYRARYDNRPLHEARLGSLGRIADGVDEVRRASREEIKNGAQFIKIMANGGVASPTTQSTCCNIPTTKSAQSWKKPRIMGYMLPHTPIQMPPFAGRLNAV